MKTTYTIIIDTFGSDKGEENVILGASMLLKEYEDIRITLVGNEQLIKSTIADLSRVKIIPCSTTVNNNDNPVDCLLDKPNASIFLALKELKEDDSAIGLISSGNTGAILVGSIKYLKVDDIRPCLAAVLPNGNETFTCLVDVGSTVDCSSKQLVQFAKLGSNFVKDLYKIKSPRVGLLSIGNEKQKGNKLVKETYPLLEEDPSINFIGNVEGNDALSGVCDVLVGDGFALNQVLKVTEGTVNKLIKDIYLYGKNNDFKESEVIINHLLEKYDIPNLGGGILLGTSKTVIKCRGNSNEYAVVNSGKMLINLKNKNNLY